MAYKIHKAEFKGNSSDSVFSFLLTLRKLKLSNTPSGVYSDVDRVLNVWRFANKYGDTPK